MITVAIPTIPPRADLLKRAVNSVLAQTMPIAALSVAVDNHKQGSAVTRNRALNAVITTWTAFLDDDDEYLPDHMVTLYSHLIEQEADAVYSLPRVLDSRGNEIPRQYEWGGGPEFDPEFLKVKSHIPTNSLVRTELAQDVGGFTFVQDPGSPLLCDDYGFWLRMAAAGAKIIHVHEPTFIWHHWGGNTSGLPDRW